MSAAADARPRYAIRSKQGITGPFTRAQVRALASAGPPPPPPGVLDTLESRSVVVADLLEPARIGNRDFCDADADADADASDTSAPAEADVVAAPDGRASRVRVLAGWSSLVACGVLVAGIVGVA